MTTKAIAFSQAALEDMSEIAEYLVMENPKAAKAFRERLEQSCKLLADMPGIGAACQFEHQGLVGVRYFPLKQFEKYLIFYRDISDTLFILRVVHGARDLPSLFGED